MKRSSWLAIALVSLLVGCSSRESVEPPAELVEFAPEGKVTTQWRSDRATWTKRRAVFTPYVSEGVIYAADNMGTLRAYTAKTGDQLWYVEINKRLTTGVSGGDGLLLVATKDGEVVALDKSNGQERWRQSVSSEVVSNPAVGAGIVVVHSIDGRIVALSQEDGRELWRYSRVVPALTLRGNGRPLIVPGGVVTGLDNGRVVALTGDKGQLVWESIVGEPHGRSEVQRLVDVDTDIQIDKRFLYAAGYQGRVAQIEPQRGRVGWTRKLSVTEGMRISDGRLYVTDENDFVYSLDTQNGGTLWKQSELKARRLSSPIPVDDYLVVADGQGYVHWLDKSDGHMVARVRVSRYPIDADPVVVDDHVIVVDRNGLMTSYRFEPETEKES